jgi:hypothetical protein
MQLPGDSRLGDPFAHQTLAAAVIRQAVSDSANPSVHRAIREQARAFLSGGDALRFWCTIAGLEAENGDANGGGGLHGVKSLTPRDGAFPHRNEPKAQTQP